MLREAVLACGDWPLLYDKSAISNTYSHVKNRNDACPITSSKVAFFESGFSAVAILWGGWLQSPASDGPPWLCLPCCSRQDAVAPVTKDIDQVSTLIELYFMFNLLELDIDNVFSQSGERFVFYMYFMPRLWLLKRYPNWSFQKLSVWFVRSIRIPGCGALNKKSHCFQITIGFITLTAVINVLGYMLLVVIFVLLGNVRHIGFVAWLICRQIGFRHIGFRHIG